jgi:HD-GYP domain-containing protein (c-di-GMP phosphodiesterase class II)
MGETLESEDPYTGGEHTWGVVSLVLRVGDEMGLGAIERRHLEFTALLQDVGKLRTPPEILNKPAALTEEEWAIVRRLRSMASRCASGSAACSPRSARASARVTSAGTAAATPTASPVRRSRRPRASSQSAMPSAR